MEFGRSFQFIDRLTRTYYLIKFERNGEMKISVKDEYSQKQRVFLNDLPGILVIKLDTQTSA